MWDTWKQIAAEAPDLARHIDGRVPVISFGAGDGARDRLLIEALKQAGRECVYSPVDASQSMLEMACGGGDDEDIETLGIKADISSPVHLVYAADAAEAPRLFIMSGNTIGAFDPLAEIRYLAQCIKDGDRLIVDGEMYDERETMALRDNPVGAQVHPGAAVPRWESSPRTMARSVSITRRDDAPSRAAPGHAATSARSAIFRRPSPVSRFRCSAASASG